MQLKTFNEILTGLCDDFDSLISPRSIARTNNNIIYLLFKAIAKGYEIVNNVCVTLDNKFNPSSCSAEDLESVANLVGTARLAGSASGLSITVKNSSAWDTVLLAGTYTYQLDDDTSFSFEVLQNTTISKNSTSSIIAFSNNYGSYPVTAQTSITVTSNVEIPGSLSFSCSDNTALLGILPETDNEFRTRINTDTSRQNTLTELETSLKNLPYLFDAKVRFNATLNSITYDGYIIPSFHMAIFYSGEAKNEIAEVVAGKGIYPTISSEETSSTKKSTALYYYNSIFTNGAYQVNLIPFKEKEYSVNIKYVVNSVYADEDTIKTSIETALYNNLNTKVHKDYVKENDIYNIIADLNLAGVDILNVDLFVNGSAVSYVEIPVSSIPKLTSVTWEE